MIFLKPDKKDSACCKSTTLIKIYKKIKIDNKTYDAIMEVYTTQNFTNFKTRITQDNFFI